MPRKLELQITRIQTVPPVDEISKPQWNWLVNVEVVHMQSTPTKDEVIQVNNALNHGVRLADGVLHIHSTNPCR